MPLDPDRPTVKLCVAGMQAEAENRFDDARALFAQAWDAAQDDLDAAIAAHYCARHAESLERILHWNQAALQFADAVATTAEGHEAVASFYPSLYLNVGKSYEDLGHLEEARRAYQLAATTATFLVGDYGEIVRRGIASGLQRTTPQ